MPRLFNTVKCPTCDGLHDLYTDSRPGISPSLEFTCPAANVPTVVIASERFSKEVPAQPPGSVPAREA